MVVVPFFSFLQASSTISTARAALAIAETGLVAARIRATGPGVLHGDSAWRLTRGVLGGVLQRWYSCTVSRPGALRNDFADLRAH
jgi:hypothetical protein